MNFNDLCAACTIYDIIQEIRGLVTVKNFNFTNNKDWLMLLNVFLKTHPPILIFDFICIFLSNFYGHIYGKQLNP